MSPMAYACFVHDCFLHGTTPEAETQDIAPLELACLRYKYETRAAQYR